MDKRINWKNVTFTLLTASNLLLLSNKADTHTYANTIEEQATQLEQLSERMNEQINELTDLLDALHDLDAETQPHDEHPTDQVQDTEPNNLNDLYYRTYLNDDTAVLIHIYSGEITLLFGESADDTDHGAIYNERLQKVLNVNVDMKFIAHCIAAYEKNNINL